MRSVHMCAFNSLFFFSTQFYGPHLKINSYIFSLSLTLVFCYVCERFFFFPPADVCIYLCNFKMIKYILIQAHNTMTKPWECFPVLKPVFIRKVSMNVCVRLFLTIQSREKNLAKILFIEIWFRNNTFVQLIIVPREINRIWR